MRGEGYEKIALAIFESRKGCVSDLQMAIGKGCGTVVHLPKILTPSQKDCQWIETSLTVILGQVKFYGRILNKKTAFGACGGPDFESRLTFAIV